MWCGRKCYFPVELFITLCKVFLTFVSVVEILNCDHSSESYWAVLPYDSVYYTIQSGSNLWICGWNKEVSTCYFYLFIYLFNYTTSLLRGKYRVKFSFFVIVWRQLLSQPKLAAAVIFLPVFFVCLLLCTNCLKFVSRAVLCIHLS